MKEEDVNGLLQIFQDCRSPDAPFTLKSHQNIKEIWKEASHMMTPVGSYEQKICDGLKISYVVSGGYCHSKVSDN